MKKFIYGSLFLALIGITFISCQKTELSETKKSNENLQLNEKQAGPIIGFYFTWERWGRKKKNCDGAGLCYFRIKKIRLGWFSVPIQQDENGEYYVEIFFDDSIKFEDEKHTFYIDENLFAKTPEGDRVMLPEGEYLSNPDLGEMGGVRLPLVVVE